MHQTEKDGERPEISLRFHRDWLSITRATHKYFSLQRHDSCLQSLQHEKLRANVQTWCRRKDLIVWMLGKFSLLRAQRQRKASFKCGVKTDAVRIPYHEFYGDNKVLTLLRQPIYSTILRLRLFANSCRYPISLILNTLAPNLYIAQEIYRLSL